MFTYLFYTRRAFVAFAFFFLSIFQGLSQDHWDFGERSGYINRYESTPLQFISNGRQSLFDIGFVTKVGGISFDVTASPSKGAHFSKIKLQYIPAKADGNRLSVVFDKISYPVFLPDWELIPIAQYANSPYTACVSLFGPSSTEYIQDAIFHPNLENTLLGLRLLQADMLFEDLDNFSQVPKLSGRYILGKGEYMPDKNKSRLAIDKIKNIISSFEGSTDFMLKEDAAAFNSYVLTDAGIDIQFEIVKNKFKITGSPYYFFFKYDRIKKAQYEQLLQFRKQFDISPQSDIDNELDIIKDKAILECYNLNNTIKNLSLDVRDINSLVNDAVVNTMRYAAFFRYVKVKFPDEWQSFLLSIQTVGISPIVSTPNSISRFQANTSEKSLSIEDDTSSIEEDKTKNDTPNSIPENNNSNSGFKQALYSVIAVIVILGIRVVIKRKKLKI